jgi:hypothetical protein
MKKRSKKLNAGKRRRGTVLRKRGEQQSVQNAWSEMKLRDQNVALPNTHLIMIGIERRL